MPSDGRSAELLAFALVLGLVLGVSLYAPPRMVGDGAEYFLVAEALARHASPDLRPADHEALRRELRDEGVSGSDALQEVPEITGRDGRTYGIHFWGYPLATLPLRWVLRLCGAGGLRALQATNALLFLGAIGVVLFESPLGGGARRALAALTLLSPALGFVLWPHPEVFSFCLTTMALVWWSAGSGRRALLAASLASTQNPPLVVLALALAAAALAQDWRRREPVGAVADLACFLPALVPSLLSLWLFGTPNVLTRGAASPANLSLGRTLELFADPNIGLLPYAPLVVAGSLWTALRAKSGGRAWGMALAMAFLCTATCNWNSGTSGPARYAVWLYPLVLFGGVASDGRLFAGGRGLAAMAIVSQAVLLSSRGGMEPRMDYLRHSALARFLLDRWPSCYNPSYEIFVERTQRREQPFPGKDPIVYRFRGECRKALAQKRHLLSLRLLCGREASNVLELRRRVAREGRAVWMYLNYD